MSYKIGLSVDNLIDLQRARDAEDQLLRIAPPMPAQFTPYKIVGTNGNGKPVTAGFPSVVWHWNRMPKKWFDYFTALLGDAMSVDVYIETRDDAGTFRDFSAVMWRPTSTPATGEARSSVDLKFTQLVAVG